MNAPIRLLLVGLGGYGNVYVSAALDGEGPSTFEVVGAVDPNPATCKRLDELTARGVRRFESMEAFYQAGGQADLTAIASPIHFHARQTCLALEHASHVLCEKPLAATLDDAQRMRQARDRAARQVAVGYQWSFSAAMTRLKQDIAAGAFGRPLCFRTQVCWPRGDRYYHRNRWAGARRAADGTWVLDSPVNNACAHHLHNMFYVLGAAPDRSAMPTAVTAELYRANAIQNYDTAALRCSTDGGVELIFIVSHATAQTRQPRFCYEFERGVVNYDQQDQPNVVAQLDDGSTHDYGSPDEPPGKKLFDVAAAIRAARPVACGIEAAVAQTLAMLAAQRSPAGIVDFPRDLVHLEGVADQRRTIVHGLDAILDQCAEQGCLPSDLPAPWARRSQPVPVNPSAL